MGADSDLRLPAVQKPTQEAEEEGKYPAREPEACGAGRVVERIVTFPLKRDWTVSSSSKGRVGVGWGLRVKDTLDPGQKKQQVLRSWMRRKVSRTAEAGEIFFSCKKNRYPCLRVSGGGAALWELSDAVIPRKSW